MSLITGKSTNTPTRVTTHEQSDEDSLASPIVTVENNPDTAAYNKALAFLAEEVEAMILPSYDEGDTSRLVEIAVNGKSYYFMRGEWRKVPRFVLEVLVLSKREIHDFGYKQAPTGATVQTTDSHYVLRHPHHFRDMDPAGMKWYDTIKDNVR